MHFCKLQIWQRSMELAKVIYKCTEKFPHTERFGLVSQLQRSAVSIPSNIAEGSQRGSSKDFAHFILIAKGSIAELQTQLILAQELQYLPCDAVQPLLEEISQIDRMMYVFRKKLVS